MGSKECSRFKHVGGMVSPTTHSIKLSFYHFLQFVKKSKENAVAPSYTFKAGRAIKLFVLSYALTQIPTKFTLCICLCFADILFFFFFFISSSFLFVYSSDVPENGLCSSSYPSSKPYHSRSKRFCSSSHSRRSSSDLNGSCLPIIFIYHNKHNA